ncbi:malto-oligosyltrehalose synthase [Novispirillum sp. DQ9]|uniref:malto-oligosyltrehalose synthase n=1 Tax=Novispirillum sp. DQ9 TaxID=3398612 RepID=UPI003C7B5AED
MMARRVPAATYRLQFHAGFTFDDAAAVIPTLAALGVTDVYASPILKARAGSMHGYDITDHHAINPELGGTDGYTRLCTALQEHGLGLVLDIVPNHMGIGLADNDWWLDVLEWGEDSPHARFFDIDWHPAKVELHGKVLLPVLGDHYGRVLEDGQLALRFDAAAGAFNVWYWDHRFPLTPTHYGGLLSEAAKEAPDLADIAKTFRDLRRRRRDRRAVAASLKERLSNPSPAALAAIEAVVGRVNGTVGKRQSFRQLHRLLEAQHYRLAFWRVASDEINYRRFFQINDLAGIRVEEPDVFDATHGLILDLVAEGTVSGLRIDHIDGLFAPRRYLHRLQDKARAAAGQDEPFYVVVEKILGTHESLREGWPVAGTTGYDFMTQVNGVFIDPAGERPLTKLYRRLLGGTLPEFADVVYEGKRLVMGQELAAELRVLANEMERVLEQDWHSRDFTTANLLIALREVVACFPVYRTYVNRDGATADDLRDIDWAIARARRMRATADPSIYDVVRGLLTTDYARTRERRHVLPEVIRLARKFQQYSGPVMAKGVEDTAFYRYNRLISLNEVGGHPSSFGQTVAAFHRQNQDRARHSPAGMLATATHDHKRGEDARARITALSELAGEWDARVRRWMTLNRRARRMLHDNGPAPHPNDEYLFYQALIGVWPLDGDLTGLRDRLVAFMTKALREAKLRTSWTAPDEQYEQAVEQFITRVLDDSRPNPFLPDVAAFHDTLAPAGMLNGLGQVVLKHVSPGVPDTYQGTELWDDSLVDPDNRRPVDYERRRALLDRLPGDPADLLRDWRSGAIKLHVVRALLHHRRAHPGLMREGAYLPLEAEGRRADHLIACARHDGDGGWLVACVPRLTVRLRPADSPWPLGEAVWGKTRLTLPDGAPTAWRNLFTGETVQTPDGLLGAAEALRAFPVAVLVAGPETET